MGVARGLANTHAKAACAIIHRDFESRSLMHVSCVSRLRWIEKGCLACMRRRLASHSRQAPSTHACFMRMQIAVDVARGLAYMHAKKAGAIIHRDLKPGNLMVSGSMYHPRCMPSHPINPTPPTFLPLCTTRTGASQPSNPTQ